MTKNPIQGCSLLATPIKQQGLVGIYETIALRLKKPWRAPNVVFMDLYCGAGINFVQDQLIDGSPLSMLEGLKRGIGKMRDGGPEGVWRILFNDIAPGRAVDVLPNHVKRWQEQHGLLVDSGKLLLPTADGLLVHIPIQYREASAQDTVARTHEMMLRHPNRTVVALIDPNGPKHAPWDALRGLWDAFPSRLKLNIHISATAMKRVAGARASGINFAPMPDHVSAMLDTFPGCEKGGWIREPTGPDQWTLLMLDRTAIRNGWPQQGLHKMDTTAGAAIRRALSMTAREMRRCA